MSTSSGPNVSANGLAFAYDMNNTQKSWLGKPTVNYITNPTEEMARGEFGQYRDLAPAFNTYGLVPYSLSMDIKVNKPGSVLVYMQNGSATKYGFVSQSINATTEYQRFYFNNITPSVSTTSETAATLATYTGYGSGVTPTVKNIQLELGSFATPFVNGTRSNTQAMKDLTNSNTITATSLTYATDGTFSFNGLGNYISLPTTLGYTTIFSAFAWIKTTGVPRGGYHIIFGSSSLEISIPTTGEIRTGVNTSNGRFVSNHGTGLTNGAWHYVGFTFDGTTKTSYIDGISVGTMSVTGTLTYSMSDRSMGVFGQGDGTYGMNGIINGAHIYNRALTAAEVQSNFAAYRGRYGI
jgi:hypothetical protein